MWANPWTAAARKNLRWLPASNKTIWILCDGSGVYVVAPAIFSPLFEHKRHRRDAGATKTCRSQASNLPAIGDAKAFADRNNGVLEVHKARYQFQVFGDLFRMGENIIGNHQSFWGQLGQ